MSNNNTENYDFLPGLVGSFAKPAAENPTVAIMEAAFRHHGLHYRYINCEVDPEDLEAAVNGAKAMGWRGFNCSIPNKVKVIPYLDKLGESAGIIGAVNTVIIGEDKKTTGENTDGKGFVKAISEVSAIQGKNIVLFGAGGAARAISVEMALAGVKKVTVLNIDNGGQELVSLLSSRTNVEATFVLWNHRYEIPPDTDIAINATSVGLYPNVDQHLNIDTNTLLPHMVVADCIPNPAYTHFVKDAISRDCRQVLPGMNMLVNQAVIAIKYWTGTDVDAEIMKCELKQVLGL
jgi:shikimate dehydrogenase